jgi:hypothetical protein
MNESYRVLKKSGILFAVSPAFPSPAAFQDPTHVNFITEATASYFLGANPPAHSLGYGFKGRFKLIRQFWAMPFNKFMNIQEKQTISSRLGPKRVRAVISGIRKPTHLVWLFEKV